MHSLNFIGEIRRINLFVRFVISSAFCVVLFSFASSKETLDLSHYLIKDVTYTYTVFNSDESKMNSLKAEPFSLFLDNTYFGFKEALGFKESQGRYSVVNKYGYMGKYQFGKSTLKLIGICGTQDFLENRKLQEQAFNVYTARNKWVLRKDIKRYSGRTIGGVYITESGILAAAHLAGAGNIKKYLRSGGAIGFSDAFGTSIRYYLKKFSGYDISLIQPRKNPKVRQ